MRIAIIFFVCLTAFAQVRHQNHAPHSDDEYARVLESSDRDAWQQPHKVIEALGLRSDEVIADIGAGTGYFSRRLAQHVRKVYAVDVNQELLNRLETMAPANVETIVSKPDDPGLPAGAIDTIFFCVVLHHIDNRRPYYGKLLRALKPGGRIVIVDFHKRELPVGPPLSMKLSEAEVIDELTAAGFEKTNSWDFLLYQYFLEFKNGDSFHPTVRRP